MSVIQFRKAVKYDARGRVAMIGPAGSGKSYSALLLARLLAGPGGKIAAIDTEHGSLSKYADLFDFDVVPLDSYTPENFIDALTAAEQSKYDVFLCDSLSHFWMGKDGALEFVDERKKRSASRGGDQMEGWKDWRPHEPARMRRSCIRLCLPRSNCSARTRSLHNPLL
jgi:energy-coupling factor transporter ATP-binding protein EcfA2